LKEKEEIFKNIYSIYDINNIPPDGDGSKSKKPMFATVEQLNQNKTEILDVVIANKTETKVEFEEFKTEIRNELNEFKAEVRTELKNFKEETNAKIDANHAESVANQTKMDAKIDANHAECVDMINTNHAVTMAMLAELKKMITDISNSNDGTKQ
jgi:HSP90 family molecular chaperone